jgi:hypothetical protein
MFPAQAHVTPNRWDAAMADDGSADGELVAIKARCQLNYLVASQPKFARNPLVIAAVETAKASEAALDAALAKAEAAPWFLLYGAYCRVREVCAELDRALTALRAALECAEAEAKAA